MSRHTVAQLGVLAWLLPAATVLGQTGGGSDLTWSTIDGGGETFSTGGDYELSGTIGQPDAGEMTGGDYALTGGFWFPAAGTTPPEGVPTTSDSAAAVIALW